MPVSIPQIAAQIRPVLDRREPQGGDLHRAIVMVLEGIKDGKEGGQIVAEVWGAFQLPSPGSSPPAAGLPAGQAGLEEEGRQEEFVSLRGFLAKSLERKKRSGWQRFKGLEDDLQEGLVLPRRGWIAAGEILRYEITDPEVGVSERARREIAGATPQWISLLLKGLKADSALLGSEASQRRDPEGLEDLVTRVGNEMDRVWDFLGRATARAKHLPVALQEARRVLPATLRGISEHLDRHLRALARAKKTISWSGLYDAAMAAPAIPELQPQAFFPKAKFIRWLNNGVAVPDDGDARNRPLTEETRKAVARRVSLASSVIADLMWAKSGHPGRDVLPESAIQEIAGGYPRSTQSRDTDAFIRQTAQLLRFTPQVGAEEAARWVRPDWVATRGHLDFGVRALAFHPGTGVLICSGLNGKVVSRHPDNGELLSSFDLLPEVERPRAANPTVLKAVAISPNGQAIAFAGSKGLVVWDRSTGRGTQLLPDPFSIQSVLAFSPDGSLLASAGAARQGEESQIHLWDVKRRKIRLTLPGHRGPVLALAFSPDREWLASSGEDGFVRLWDVAAGVGGLLRSSGEGRWRAHALRFSHDGKRLAWGDWAGGVALWDPATGNVLSSSQVSRVNITALAFSPDDRTLAVGDYEGLIRLLDLEAQPPKVRIVLDIERGAVASLAFNPEGSKLAAAGRGQVLLWDAAWLQTLGLSSSQGDAFLEEMATVAPLLRTLRADRSARPPLEERVRAAERLHELGLLVPREARDLFGQMPSLGSRQAALLDSTLYRAGRISLKTLLRDFRKLLRWEAQARRRYGEDHLFAVETHSAVLEKDPRSRVIQRLLEVMMHVEGNVEGGGRLRIATVFEQGGLEIQSLPSYSGEEVQAFIWERWEDLAEWEGFSFFPIFGEHINVWLHANFGGELWGLATETFLYRWVAVQAELGKEDSVRGLDLAPQRKEIGYWGVRYPRPSKLGGSRTEATGMVYVWEVKGPDSHADPLRKRAVRLYRRQLFRELHRLVWAFRHRKDDLEAWVRETADLPPLPVNTSWTGDRRIEMLQAFYDDRLARLHGPGSSGVLDRLKDAFQQRGMELAWDEVVERDPALWRPLDRLLAQPDGVDRLLRERRWSWGLELEGGERLRLVAPEGGGDPYVAYDHFVDRYLRGKVAAGLPALLFRKDGVYRYEYDGLWRRFDDLWVPEGLAEFLSDRDLAVAVMLPPQADGIWWNRLKLLLDPRHLRRFVEQGESAAPDSLVSLRVGGKDLGLAGAVGHTARDLPSGRELSTSFIVKAAAQAGLPAGQAGLEEEKAESFGVVAVEGVVAAVPAWARASVYGVTVGLAQTQAAVELGTVPPSQLIAVAADAEEAQAIAALGVPEVQVVGTKAAGIQLAQGILKTIGGFSQIRVLDTAAGTLRELRLWLQQLPAAWQGSLTASLEEQVLQLEELSQVGV